MASLDKVGRVQKAERDCRLQLWFSTRSCEFAVEQSRCLISNTKITQFQVQTVSISYLRCLIEHVRCFILDRDIELVYYTIRKSSDVLTRDPMQLGAQVITFTMQLMLSYEIAKKMLKSFNNVDYGRIYFDKWSILDFISSVTSKSILRLPWKSNFAFEKVWINNSFTSETARAHLKISFSICSCCLDSRLATSWNFEKWLLKH